MKKTIFLFIILTFVIVNFGCTNKCKVEFDDLDSETENVILNVNSGDTISMPNDPVKEGYIFRGWYYNDELFDFQSQIVSNITLMAKYEKIKEINKITYKEKENIYLGGNGINDIPVLAYCYYEDSYDTNLIEWNYETVDVSKIGEYVINGEVILDESYILAEGISTNVSMIVCVKEPIIIDEITLPEIESLYYIDSFTEETIPTEIKIINDNKDLLKVSYYWYYQDFDFYKEGSQILKGKVIVPEGYRLKEGLSYEVELNINLKYREFYIEESDSHKERDYYVKHDILEVYLIAEGGLFSFELEKIEQTTAGDMYTDRDEIEEKRKKIPKDIKFYTEYSNERDTTYEDCEWKYIVNVYKKYRGHYPYTYVTLQDANVTVKIYAVININGIDYKSNELIIDVRDISEDSLDEASVVILCSKEDAKYLQGAYPYLQQKRILNGTPFNNTKNLYYKIITYPDYVKTDQDKYDYLKMKYETKTVNYNCVFMKSEEILNFKNILPKYEKMFWDIYIGDLDSDNDYSSFLVDGKIYGIVSCSHHPYGTADNGLYYSVDEFDEYYIEYPKYANIGTTKAFIDWANKSKSRLPENKHIIDSSVTDDMLYKMMCNTIGTTEYSSEINEFIKELHDNEIIGENGLLTYEQNGKDGFCGVPGLGKKAEIGKNNTMMFVLTNEYETRLNRFNIISAFQLKTGTCYYTESNYMEKIKKDHNGIIQSTNFKIKIGEKQYVANSFYNTRKKCFETEIGE